MWAIPDIYIYENRFDTVTVPDHEHRVIIDQFWHGRWSKTISVWAGATLTHLLLMKHYVSLDVRIESCWEWARIDMTSLVVADGWWEVSLTAHAHLMHPHAMADLHIISFLKDGAVAHIDWWVDLHPRVHKVSGHLLEENIVLWDQIDLKTLPMLDVRSSDVSASHWCRIERLDPKKMFYLQSRWLDHLASRRLLLEWYVDNAFGSVTNSIEEKNASSTTPVHNINKQIETIQQTRLEHVLA